MFDLSFSEIALVVVVAVIFIGPKDLPVILRVIAKAMRGMRSLMKEMRGIFDDITRESGLADTADEVKRDIQMIKGDDGKMYERYDLPHIAKTPATPPDAPS